MILIDVRELAIHRRLPLANTFIKRTGKKPAVLIFSFTQFVGLNIRSPFDIEIPVPEGWEELARKIAEREMNAVVR